MTVSLWMAAPLWLLATAPPPQPGYAGPVTLCGKVPGALPGDTYLITMVAVTARLVLRTHTSRQPTSHAFALSPTLGATAGALAAAGVLSTTSPELPAAAP